MAKAKRKFVREPLIQVEGKVTTVGKNIPVRIVIHTTECHDSPGTREISGVFNFWKNQNRGLGAHLIIDKDGNSGKGADFKRITQAVKGGNTGSVHIELIGFARFTPQLWWVRIAQLNKTAKWIAYLNKEFRIPIEHSIVAGVAGHKEFPGNDHTDPGKFFPMKYVLRKARKFRVEGWT